MPQEKESFSNIFEAAGKIEKSKVEKKQEGAPEQPLSDEEISARFERCKELHNLIQDKLEKAFVDHNMTQKQVREYFDSPQHFSEKQWRLIQEQKEEIALKLKELVPKVRSSVGSGHGTSSSQKKPKIMQTKSRWMPMR